MKKIIKFICATLMLVVFLGLSTSSASAYSATCPHYTTKKELDYYIVDPQDYKVIINGYWCEVVYITYVYEVTCGMCGAVLSHPTELVIRYIPLTPVIRV